MSKPKHNRMKPHEAEIDRLRKEVDHARGWIATWRAAAEKIQRDRDTLTAEIAAKDEEIKALTAELIKQNEAVGYAIGVVSKSAHNIKKEIGDRDAKITRLTAEVAQKDAEVERLREDYLDLRHSNCDEWIDRVSAMGQEVSKCGCGRPAAHFTQDGVYLCCSCHHSAEMIAISEETRAALEGKEA